MKQQFELDYFSSLNDDCVFEIFDRLSLNELCAVSETCKKLQKIAENHFQRKYPELVTKKVTIEEKRGVIGFREQDYYVKCFSRQIQSIKIWCCRGDDRLIQFIRLKCCPNIKKMIFYDLQWTIPFESEFQAVFRKVESVSFEAWNSVDLDEVLKNFNSTKHLKIATFLNRQKLTLPSIVCSNLETFEYEISDSAALNDLEYFFQQNPIIKKFICHMHRPVHDWIKQILKILINIDIEAFCLDISNDTDCDIDFTLIRNELKMLDDRDQFKRFELKLCSHTTQLMKYPFELGSLKSFSGFHLVNWNESAYLEKHIPAFNLFVNLTILELWGGVSDAMAISLAQNLSNLSDLYFNGTDPKGIVTPFVYFSPNLKKIVLFSHQTVEDMDLNVQQMNEERKKLKDASKLVIYQAHLEENPIFSKCYQNTDLVKFKRILMFESEWPNLSNSLINYEFLYRKCSL